MTGGQESLLGDDNSERADEALPYSDHVPRPSVRVLQANAEELVLHAQQLQSIEKTSGGKCLWQQIERVS